MKPISNETTCRWKVGDTLRFVSGTFIKVRDIILCEDTMCPGRTFLCGGCTGYWLIDCDGMKWHDILHDFTLVSPDETY